MRFSYCFRNLVCCWRIVNRNNGLRSFSKPANIVLYGSFLGIFPLTNQWRRPVGVLPIKYHNLMLTERELLCKSIINATRGEYEGLSGHTHWRGMEETFAWPNRVQHRARARARRCCFFHIRRRRGVQLLARAECFAIAPLLSSLLSMGTKCVRTVWLLHRRTPPNSAGVSFLFVLTRPRRSLFHIDYSLLLG